MLHVACLSRSHRKDTRRPYCPASLTWINPHRPQVLLVICFTDDHHFDTRDTLSSFVDDPGGEVCSGGEQQRRHCRDGDNNDDGGGSARQTVGSVVYTRVDCDWCSRPGRVCAHVVSFGRAVHCTCITLQYRRWCVYSHA